jgi:mono/diheme cytochrome c family protein
MRLPLAVFGMCLFASARADDHFETHIRPLLLERCVGCHGPDKQKGELRLDSKAGWQTGGERGAAIKPGKPDDSPLMKAVRGKDGFKQMPPDKKLSEPEIAALAKWIADGAADRIAG